MSDIETDTQNLTHEGGFQPVIARMQARQKPLSFAAGEALPPLDADIETLKTKLVC